MSRGYRRVLAVGTRYRPIVWMCHKPSLNGMLMALVEILH